MAAGKTIDWSLRSLEHLSNLFDYLNGQMGFDRAETYIENLLQFGNRLSTKASHYAPCRNPKLQAEGYRCAKFKNKYTLVYFEYATKITILAVVHVRMGDLGLERSVF